jgi:cobaltochelatase CobS
MTATATPPSVSTDKITCQICGMQDHVIKLHLEKHHSGVTVADYQKQYPHAPIYSPRALAAIKANHEKREAASATVAPPPKPEQHVGFDAEFAALHEVYGFKGKEAMNHAGAPIPITRFATCSYPEMVPEIDPGYVFNVDEVKDVQLALELNLPAYVWGHKGCGKTDLVTQMCARTGRPMVRVQHTINTEESHIVGQMAAAAGATFFEFGPLPLAMKYGWTYLADEYDFAMPSVTSVYQAVLEGKPLFIKEAPAAERMIKPHPNFRFVATGNTNGTGDETGLYQGTVIQNSANYDRFTVVLHKQYMDADDEKRILMNKAHLIPQDAELFVDFATRIRESYAAGKLADTISPRTLIAAARIGMLRRNFKHGLSLSFVNKLSSVDREVAGGIVQRIFG